MDKLTALLTISSPDMVFECFEEAAHDIIDHWVIRKDEEDYEILEIEFFFYSKSLQHEDPYVLRSPIQQTFGRWMFHLGGAEITIGEPNRFGSIQIRAVRNKGTGEVLNGPQRVFRALFEDGGDVFHPDGLPILRRESEGANHAIIAAPRVGLNLTEFSDRMDIRVDYILRPYRFVSAELKDFADKYLAYLFMDRVSGVDVDLKEGHTIYSKYLDAFAVGQDSTSLEKVWEERSKPLRMARLLGRMAKQNELIEPILSNEASPSS